MIIEEMTENFFNKSMEKIGEIDSMGGAIEAISSGFIERDISKSAFQYQKLLESEKKIIVGINKFQNEEEHVGDLLDIDLNKVDLQIKELKSYKSSRNNNQVGLTLENLKSTAKSNKNIMPDIIHCIKNDCTLGEISDALRTVFSEY